MKADSNKDHLNDVWTKNPHYIRRFYDNLKTNEKLCQEISYIISTEIEHTEIEIAQVSYRAKSLESFCEKIVRKQYKNPFDQVTDFAGVRVVYLYSAHRKEIEEIIEKEFEILEKIDKTIDDAERFGYGALHYLVKIKNNHIGARYNDLKNKTCEIQVRTILQDAWALVAHHLSYKQESDAPKELRRKLNALSGLFETADDQFEAIRNSRLEYQEHLKPLLQTSADKSLEEANIDSLTAYVNSRLPNRQAMTSTEASELINELRQYGKITISDIDTMINSALQAVLEYEKDEPPRDQDGEQTTYKAVGIARMALCFTSEEYRSTRASPERYENYLHLVKSLKPAKRTPNTKRKSPRKQSSTN